MKKVIPLFLVAISISVNSQTKNIERPKLVVGIVVDQMKQEYLYRFYDDFSENGFKKLINQGFVFQNAHQNHMPTYTAPGHTAIYTGATPSITGIVGNSWFDKTTLQTVYCTDDASVSTLGPVGSEKEGKMSPKNLEATTITDELRLATNFKGKVIGISIKDRTSILPAGHFANWAFWYSKTGDFISSTFYGDKLPDWVVEFNSQKKYMEYINKGWDLLQPVANYNESFPDKNPYESKIYDVAEAVFPYDLKKMYEKNGPKIITTTPYGNDLVADFAIKAIEKEELGKDNITDFLAVSFSSTDYVGHELGSRSMEIQDTYLRLDKTIENLLKYLDQTVGKGQYLLFLSSDHGAAENANSLKDNKYSVKNINHEESMKSLNNFSMTTFGENLILKISNYNVFLNKELIEKKGLELTKVKEIYKNYFLKQEQIRRVYTEDEVMSACSGDYFLKYLQNSYTTRKSGELFLVMKPGYSEYDETGTTHGSPYSYDTHVPLIFYGWKIKKGESFSRKEVPQIAPTLSQKIKIPFTNGTQVNVLEEILGNGK